MTQGRIRAAAGARKGHGSGFPILSFGVLVGGGRVWSWSLALPAWQAGPHSRPLDKIQLLILHGLPSRDI